MVVIKRNLNKFKPLLLLIFCIIIIPLSIMGFKTIHTYYFEINSSKGYVSYRECEEVQGIRYCKEELTIKSVATRLNEHIKDSFIFGIMLSLVVTYYTFYHKD